MKRSLRTQMFMQYAALVLICMLVIPTGISKLLDLQFKRFTESKLAEEEHQVVQFMEELYSVDENWNIALLSRIRTDIFRWPMMSISLSDASGNAIWEFRRPFMRQNAHGSHRERGRSFEMQPELYLVRESKVFFAGQEVGTIRFTYLPFVESREGLFLKQFNRLMFSAIGLMLLFAAVIAFIMAGRISKPVLRVAERAASISRGRYRSAEKMTSKITEIETLIESVDRLGLSLEAQEELRKRMVGDVAHELRSPLTIVKSHLEAFEDGVWSPTPDRIKLTVDEIDRLSERITGIERLASLESGEEKMEFVSCDLSTELERTALSFEPVFRDKQITLERQIETDVTVDADMPKLKRAVENLLSNALRYTDPGGRVTLSLVCCGGTAEISVTDNGIGIPEADLANIFDRFYRTDKSRARVSGGMGIGLAIAKATVEAHGGTVSVESREGEGSRFTIRLPLAGQKNETKS